MRKITLLLVLILCNTLFAQLEIPKLGENDSIVHHNAYSLSFNSKYLNANWVAYLLTREETNSLFERSNFIEDPLIEGTNLSKDYYKSGYDRGHLAPAGDMAFSKIAMDESFYYSNMSPQVPSFNRGIWKKLETQVRNWAIEYDSLYVVTGPVFTPSMKLIGPDKVSVPNFYYKVILDNHKGKEKMIGFLMENIGSNSELDIFVLPVDNIEEITGIDFFPLLSDELEIKLESDKCLYCWFK